MLAISQGSEVSFSLFRRVRNILIRKSFIRSELLETLLRLPSELGTTAFRSVWRFEEIGEMGDLFADWLRRIRHRGAAMTLHPCYARAAGVLLIAGQDWPEVGKLPAQWLNVSHSH